VKAKAKKPRKPKPTADDAWVGDARNPNAQSPTWQDLINYRYNAIMAKLDALTDAQAEIVRDISQIQRYVGALARPLHDFTRNLPLSRFPLSPIGEDSKGIESRAEFDLDT
jgi:hypothetical protein